MKKVHEPADATELAVVSAALEAAEIPFLVENEARFLDGGSESPRDEAPAAVIVPDTAYAAARAAIRVALGGRGVA